MKSTLANRGDFPTIRISNPFAYLMLKHLRRSVHCPDERRLFPITIRVSTYEFCHLVGHEIARSIRKILFYPFKCNKVKGYFLDSTKQQS